jgi:hypothetical protein
MLSTRPRFRSQQFVPRAPTVIAVFADAASTFVATAMHARVRVLLAGLLLATVAVFCPRPAVASGIGIQPGNIEMAATPGTTIRQSIRVGNLRTDRPQQFIVGIADWSLDQNGQLVLTPPSAASAASWTRFAPARFTLKAAEAQNIIVDISVPAKIDAKEYRVAILVTNPIPSPEEMKKLNGVWNQTQVASLLYLIPQGIAPKTTVSGVEWVPQDAKGTLFRAQVKNEGSAHARLIAVTSFLDADGKAVHSTDSQAVFLEGQTREWRAIIQAEHLPPAAYTVKWKLYNVFDPKRPNERAGELIQEQEWKWNKTTPAAKAPPSVALGPSRAPVSAPPGAPTASPSASPTAPPSAATPSNTPVAAKPAKG